MGVGHRIGAAVTGLEQGEVVLVNVAVVEIGGQAVGGAGGFTMNNSK